jgi:hypothetical protein
MLGAAPWPQSLTPPQLLTPTLPSHLHANRSRERRRVKQHPSSFDYFEVPRPLQVHFKMPAIPASKTYTLRIKQSTTTIVLFADPAQSLTSLKESLLEALKATNPSGSFYSQTIPDDPAEVELALPVDVFDAEKGWDLIFEIRSPSLDDENTRRSSKGKGKAIVKDAGLSIRGAGIKDNAVLAFRFKKDDGEEEDEAMADDPGWDVQVSVYEDVYGVENRGDLGVIPEFKG